jgi:hypothetical protein
MDQFEQNIKERNKTIWKASCLFVEPGQSFSGVAEELKKDET